MSKVGKKDNPNPNFKVFIPTPIEKSQFPAFKKGKAQFPIYPFRTLPKP